MSTIMTRPLWTDLLASWPFEEWPKGRPEMRLETYFEASSFVVKAEIPGVDPDKDVTVEIQDGVLTIRAERKEETREELPEGFRSEFRYGSLARQIMLPEGAVEDDVKATYTDGVLEVRVPIGDVTTSPATVPITRL